MKYIKAFAHVFYKSLFSVKYYKDLLAVKTSFSLKYFLAISLFSALVAILFMLVPVYPDIQNAINEGLAQSKELYPQELEINIKDGNISINQPEPYFIKSPKPFSVPSLEGDKIINNLVVFNSEGTLDEVEKDNALVLVNKVNILVQQGDSIDVIPLSDVPDTTITGQDYNNFIAKLGEFAAAVPTLVMVLGSIILIIYYVGFRLLYAAMLGGLLFLVGKVRGSSLKFDPYYRVSIHTMTLPLLMEAISVIAGVPIAITAWFFVVHFIYGLIVVTSLSE